MNIQGRQRSCGSFGRSTKVTRVRVKENVDSRNTKSKLHSTF